MIFEFHEVKRNIIHLTCPQKRWPLWVLTSLYWYARNSSAFAQSSQYCDRRVPRKACSWNKTCRIDGEPFLFICVYTIMNKCSKRYIRTTAKNQVIIVLVRTQCQYTYLPSFSLHFDLRGQTFSLCLLRRLLIFYNWASLRAPQKQ
jgi:hypothetical protein